MWDLVIGHWWNWAHVAYKSWKLLDTRITGFYLLSNNLPRTKTNTITSKYCFFYSNMIFIFQPMIHLKISNWRGWRKFVAKYEVNEPFGMFGNFLASRVLLKPIQFSWLNLLEWKNKYWPVNPAKSISNLLELREIAT